MHWVSLYLWTSKLALKRLPCHRPVSSSVSFSVGFPDTVANTIRVRPFLDILSSSSGLDGSTLEKSMGGGDLLCSGRSPSSMSSSLCGKKEEKSCYSEFLQMKMKTAHHAETLDCTAYYDTVPGCSLLAQSAVAKSEVQYCGRAQTLWNNYFCIHKISTFYKQNPTVLLFNHTSFLYHISPVST